MTNFFENAEHACIRNYELALVQAKDRIYNCMFKELGLRKPHILIHAKNLQILRIDKHLHY